MEENEAPHPHGSGGLIVGLAYNLKRHCPDAGGMVEDAAAEYESEETVAGIAGAIEDLGHQVVHLPYRPSFPQDVLKARPDIVFNIAEGWQGRNREALIPAILEFYHIPYTGSDPLTLAATLDKAVAKMMVAAAGIRTPAFLKVESPVQCQKAHVRYPVFVKPCCEGSSKGIRFSSLARNRRELLEKVAWVTHTYGQAALVEEFLPGREFTVGIIGNEELTVLPIMEVVPGPELATGGEQLFTGGEEDSASGAGESALASTGAGTEFIYSYEVKSGNLERFLCPAPLEPGLEAAIRHLAVRAYRVLECRDLARVDIRLDKTGRPNFLEVNPLPGLSAVSLFPLQARAAGMSFRDLVGGILDASLRRLGLGRYMAMRMIG